MFDVRQRMTAFLGPSQIFPSHHSRWFLGHPTEAAPVSLRFCAPIWPTRIASQKRKRGSASIAEPLSPMVGREGFEPSAYGLRGDGHNLLLYAYQPPAMLAKLQCQYRRCLNLLVSISPWHKFGTASLLVFISSMVLKNQVIELLLLQFSIGAPEEMNLGTGSCQFPCPNWLLDPVKTGHRWVIFVC
jgi:hypothetical protein